MSGKKKLVLDVDTGTDDAQAIMLALSHPSAELVAVTCVFGNAGLDQVCLNTLRVLQACGRLDVPVYRGATKPLLGTMPEVMSSSYHGNDGLGDAPDPDTPTASMIQKEHAVDALIRLSKEHEGELTLVTLAPLTNVALALRLDPNLGKRFKEVIIMGGNMHAVGNIQPSVEYNFYCDPDAAYVTLREIGGHVTLVPVEPTITSVGAPDLDFYDKEIATLTTPKALFHHKIIGVTDKKRRELFQQCVVCDVCAVALAIVPDLITKSSHEYCTVELRGEVTRSQVVVDWRGHWKKEPNVLLVAEYDLERFKKIYKDMFLN